jgi:general secretion pathway protein D
MRSTVATIAIAFAVGWTALPALAASTLNTVQVNGQANGDALVSVSFAGSVPPYHVVGAGTTETAIIFDTTTLGPQVAPTVAGAGPVTTVSVASTGTSASVALHLTSAASVRVRTGGLIVFISVVGNGLAAAGAASAATTATGLGPVTEVVELKYADISEIAGVLVAGSTIATNDNFAPVQTNIGSNSLSGSIGGTNGGFAQPAVTQTFGQFGQQSTGLAQRVNDNIAVDRRLNAIILSGTPEVVAALKAIIDKLDIPVPSVILETQIVELSESASRNIGLDFSPDGSGIVINGTRTSTTTTTTGSTGLLTQTGQQAQAAATLQAALYAQVTEGNGRVIAKPRILAQSGQQASILTGDAIPVFTQVVAANVGTASQVNYINVGVNLQIQPRVSSDGYVTSHIYSEVSSVTGTVNGAPQISQRTASTSATVRDGEAFIIGGLLQDNELRSLSKLPFIGDLPLIGQLFRHISTSHSLDNLYIVVTPHIVGMSAATNPSPLVLPSALPQMTPSQPAPQQFRGSRGLTPPGTPPSTL